MSTLPELREIIPQGESNDFFAALTQSFSQLGVPLPQGDDHIVGFPQSLTVGDCIAPAQFGETPRLIVGDCFAPPQIEGFCEVPLIENANFPQILGVQALTQDTQPAQIYATSEEEAREGRRATGPPPGLGRSEALPSTPQPSQVSASTSQKRVSMVMYPGEGSDLDTEFSSDCESEDPLELDYENRRQRSPSTTPLPSKKRKGKEPVRQQSQPPKRDNQDLPQFLGDKLAELQLVQHQQLEIMQGDWGKVAEQLAQNIQKLDMNTEVLAAELTSTQSVLQSQGGTLARFEEALRRLANTQDEENQDTQEQLGLLEHKIGSFQTFLEGTPDKLLALEAYVQNLHNQISKVEREVVVFQQHPQEEGRVLPELQAKLLSLTNEVGMLREKFGSLCIPPAVEGTPQQVEELVRLLGQTNTVSDKKIGILGGQLVQIHQFFEE